mgnify:CR=1 FL=1
MSQKNLGGSLALTKLIHVKMNVKGKDKQDVLGMFIPFDANKLVIGEPDENNNSAVYLPIRVIYKTEADDKGQNGFIAKSLPSEVYKEMATTDAGKQLANTLTPILGSIKDFTDGNNASADTGGAASTEVFSPEDDMPF